MPVYDAGRTMKGEVFVISKFIDGDSLDGALTVGGVGGISCGGQIQLQADKGNRETIFPDHCRVAKSPPRAR